MKLTEFERCGYKSVYIADMKVRIDACDRFQSHPYLLRRMMIMLNRST